MDAGKIERKLESIQLTKKDWLQEKIKEELELNGLLWDIKCPYCGDVFEVDLEQFLIDSSGYERKMGTETEYTIECEEFECPNCEKVFEIKGSIWEYPEGVYNNDSIKTVIIEEDE